MKVCILMIDEEGVWTPSARASTGQTFAVVWKSVVLIFLAISCQELSKGAFFV